MEQCSVIAALEGVAPPKIKGQGQRGKGKPKIKVKAKSKVKSDGPCS
jgi:hypothetical protein